MDFPFKPAAAISAVVAYGATTCLRSRWSTAAFAGYFTAGFLAHVLGYALWSIILYPKFFSPFIGLPQPKPSSWYNGNWKEIQEQPSGTPMHTWMTTIPNNGVIRYLGLLNQERLLVTSPQGLAEVLVTKNYDFEKPRTMRYGLGRILGIGILLAEGEEHKFQRKNLMPAFAFRHVKDLYQVFWQKSCLGVQAMVKQIERDAAKAPVGPPTADTEKEAPNKETSGKTGVLEVGAWASRIALDIIGLAGLGCDFGAIDNPDNKLFKTYNYLFKPSRQAQLLNLLGLIFPMWIVALLPVQRNEDVAAAATTIRGVCHELIREKKDRLARRAPADVDILSVALESGAFADDNLVDQLMTFLAAGHETTASSMTWAVYLLARHPDVQRRLRAEVRATLPGITAAAAATTTVSSLDVDRMLYLHAVASEVLRYLAPVPLTLREAAVATRIQGVRVPRGTRVVLAIAATNRDPALWGPTAAAFRPARWLPEEEEETGGGGARAPPSSSSSSSSSTSTSSSNYAFMTFLHGPRSCIGKAFARAEFACLLAAWVGAMAFELADPEEADECKVEVKSGVTMRPAKGMHVKVTVLDGW